MYAAGKNYTVVLMKVIGETHVGLVRGPIAEEERTKIKDTLIEFSGGAEVDFVEMDCVYPAELIANLHKAVP